LSSNIFARTVTRITDLVDGRMQFLDAWLRRICHGLPHFRTSVAAFALISAAPLMAQDLKTDDFVFVPYTKANPRNITGYYEVLFLR
jgi:hypothetical protein